MLDVIFTRGSTKMKITRNSEIPTADAGTEHFTGSVTLEPLFQPQDGSRALGATVTFQPSARTDWHTHPLGQVIIVTSGTGLVQSEGGPIKQINPGDVVWCPPGEKHWHGATPNSAMSHIVVVEQKDGVAANWLEKVSDEEYAAEIEA